MKEYPTPVPAAEEEWILKYRAAMNAEFAQQSRTLTIHKLLRRTLDQVGPASEWILHRYVRPPLEKAVIAIRRELPHLY